MDGNSNSWHFKRGLDPDFMKKLEFVAKSGGWFAHVLADPDLILGVRDNYLQVYWHGCSLFKIQRHGKSGSLIFSTHPKYLIDPGLSKEVSFDGSAFQVDKHEALAKQYGPETLSRMKRAAKPYSGGEKNGVHAIACANPDVIDLEVAFNGEADEEDERAAQRIDLACFEEVEGKLRLRFWEAKLYRNPALFAEGETDAPVVGQIYGYLDLIEEHRQEIVDSYRAVARNLAEIGSWGRSKSTKLGELIGRVANDEAFILDEPPFVGLIVYDYDETQFRSSRWKTHMDKIKSHSIFIQSRGKAKGMKLRGRRSASTR